MAEPTCGAARPCGMNASELPELVIRILALMVLIYSITLTDTALVESIAALRMFESTQGVPSGISVPLWIAGSWIPPASQVIGGVLLLLFARRIAGFINGDGATSNSPLDFRIDARGAYRIGITVLGCYALTTTICPLVQGLFELFWRQNLSAETRWFGLEKITEAAAYLAAGFFLVVAGRRLRSASEAE